MVKREYNKILNNLKSRYDKKYNKDLLNIYKYFDSSVKLTQDLLKDYLDEIKCKVIIKNERELLKPSSPTDSIINKQPKIDKERLSIQLDSEEFVSKKTGRDAIAEAAFNLLMHRGVGSDIAVKFKEENPEEDRDLDEYGNAASFIDLCFKKAGYESIGNNLLEQIDNKSGAPLFEKEFLEPGDVVFFESGGRIKYEAKLPTGEDRIISHAGIFVGDYKFIDLSAEKESIYLKLFGEGEEYENYFNNNFIMASRF